MMIIEFRKKIKNQKIFYPINLDEKNLFNINQNFRVLTRNLQREKIPFISLIEKKLQKEIQKEENLKLIIIMKV